MEDIRAIYRIFNNLKYEMENNGWVYQGSVNYSV